MIWVENVETSGWLGAIRGMRNPMQSWVRSDTYKENELDDYRVVIGPNDLDLMTRLAKAGPEHAKYLRMIQVTADVSAPEYWWKEYATYKVGTTENSTSTMHRIAAREFVCEDFSVERVTGLEAGRALATLVYALNRTREEYLQEAKPDRKRELWYTMVQLLPMSYMYLRTICTNYQALANIYHQRKAHKLDEWREFCKWVETLPYSELITGEEADDAD